ncbi:MAG: hypothetical protein MUP47_03775 [Phycisphaerae bacterium]|nr:hypothetical protein [Phycisphaerae bacterium]
MRTLGCLTIIVLVGVGIFLLAGSQDMTEAERAQWVGEKAHRGWSKARQLLQQAREGWQSGEQAPADSPDR